MTNSIAVTIIAFLMAVNIGILLKLFFFDLRKSKDKLLIYITVACISLLGWQIDNLIYYLTSDVGIMRFTYDFKLPFVACTSLYIALTVIRFYRLDHYLNKTSIMIMLIIPTFTLMYSLISPNNELIRESFSVVSILPMHEVNAVRGVWFWVHTACCYAFILGALIIGIYCHRKLPRTYRAPSYVLLSGIAIVVLINVLQVTNINYQHFDISFVGTSIAIIAVYFSVIQSKGVDFITNARIEIYDYLSEGIFVLNDERYIVYLNSSARQKISSLNLNAINELYDNVFEQAVSHAVNIEAAPADEDGLDMTFIENGVETVYNLSEKPIKDRSGVPIGTFSVLDDVTENRAIIGKLENIGGIDALTGLPNRRSIEKFMDNVDNASKLPIAVISVDVNGLKQVNDNLGHKQGDVLIRLVAEILEEACLAKGRVSRIGGDEFLIVVPNTSEEEVEQIIRDADRIMDGTQEYLFKPSVSFGYEIKTEEGQDMTAIVQKADEKMYADKAERKRLVESFIN